VEVVGTALTGGGVDVRDALVHDVGEVAPRGVAVDVSEAKKEVSSPQEGSSP